MTAAECSSERDPYRWGGWEPSDHNGAENTCASKPPVVTLPAIEQSSAVTLAARRNIASGEELTADYAMWLDDTDWDLTSCRCGSPVCRGAVRGSDWQIPQLQERYAGHFTPFLNRLIARLKEQTPG